MLLIQRVDFCGVFPRLAVTGNFTLKNDTGFFVTRSMTLKFTESSKLEKTFKIIHPTIHPASLAMPRSHHQHQTPLEHLKEFEVT